MDELQSLASHSFDEDSDADIDDNINDNAIQVTIKKLDGETFSIYCQPTSTVLGLKDLINNSHSISSTLQRLIFRAQELQNDFPIAQYGVQDGSTLHLVVRRNIGDVDADNAGQVAINVGDDLPILQAQDMIDVMSVVRLCRFVRIFSLIDGIFLLIYGLSQYYFIILAVLAIAGYWGAKNLARKYLVMYGLCLLLEIALRSYLIYLAPHNVVSIILLVLMIMIDLFVFRCVLKLYTAIPLLTVDQRERILILNRVGLI